MYESLTRYLPEFDKVEGYGEWVIDHESKGTMDDPIQMPYVDYGPLVMGVYDAIYTFEEGHPEYGLNRYNDILDRNGLKWDGRMMSEADVSQLDGQAVTALILGAVRADRFCEGALLGFFEDGSMRRWLERLADLDHQMEDRHA